jgi:hypothetical protein
LRRLAPVVAIDTLYERLEEHGQRLAIPRWGGDTPYEFTTAFTGRLEGLAQGRWRKILSPATGELRSLTQLYVQTAYSPRPPGPDDQKQILQTWQRLRGRLWLAWLVILGRKLERLIIGALTPR